MSSKSSKKHKKRKAKKLARLAKKAARRHTQLKKGPPPMSKGSMGLGAIGETEIVFRHRPAKYDEMKDKDMSHPIEVEDETPIKPAHNPALAFLNAPKIYPLPEIFPDGRDWRVVKEKNAAGVDYKERTIRVPLDDDALSHCIRMQQISRIKWDDPNVATEETLLFRAVEDYRITHLMKDGAKLDVHAGFLTMETMAMLSPHMGQKCGLLAVMLMTEHTQYECSPQLKQEPQHEEVVKFFDEVCQEIKANPTKMTTAQIVKKLRTRISDQALPEGLKKKRQCPPPGKYNAGKANGDPCDFMDMYDWAWDDLDDDDRLVDIPKSVRDQLPDELPEHIAARFLQHLAQNNTFVPWGNMSLDEPNRAQRVLGKFHRKWKPTEEGVFPRYPHRFFVDQRIFGRRFKIPGGTVVIDSSGSMGLTPEAIQKIVEYAPGCVVANYSGTAHAGVLRILAKNGMRVVNEKCAPPCGGGNIVDYPALKWAYKQMHPRVWVSDLGVTGINDQPGSGNLAMCAAAVKKGKFFHASHMDQAIQILKRLGRYYKK